LNEYSFLSGCLRPAVDVVYLLQSSNYRVKWRFDLKIDILVTKFISFF